MKRILATAAFVGICTITSFAEKARSKGTVADVIVEDFPVAVSSDIPQANKIIWEFISKRPEQQWFIHYSTKDWRKNYDAFCVELVAKAKSKTMEYGQLERLLKKLPSSPFIQQDHNSEKGCLPIGAYPLVIEGKKLWLIFCLWEYADDPSTTKYVAPPKVSGEVADAKPMSTKMDWATVGHVLAIAYHTDGEVFTFVSCD